MVSEKGRVVWSTEALVDLEAIYDFLAEHYYNTSRALMPGARITLPGHTLITRYQYNSLNQLIWQQTPDAGELQFWYNDKGQLRLSQNAQQRADTLYSYTKYDEQGRIVEVGELATVTAIELEDLLTRADSLQWPQAEQYALTDITRTHYDLPAVALAEAGFAQSYLRTRVSWVEVVDKNYADTVATYYSYDVHGNVKSLQQYIPGLDAKRTDYVYDLISGKVNYVMYQFDRPDQFIHRYDYDSDNRITSVSTSTDGFIWDEDASYRYYSHGPLARVELGEHRVQGLDYYYTLQSWIKGVNMPYAGDPGGDGITSISGKDVFAYSLGYYNQDYKPITNSVTLSDSRDQLWPRLNEVHGHSGLYNGNISWMVTDLSKVGEVNNDRNKGLQAMVYKYDQLHRITKSRSLTQYNSANGFASRDGSPHAYDEDYSYDPNGNLLTLDRKDHQGSVLHDFDYGYYPNTNKLRQVGPPEDMVYSGALSSNTKLYRKITLQGNAYVPQDKPVEIRALEEIEMDPDFEAEGGTDFLAHIVADSGMYQYDKIGNLVLDQHEGVKISWTPYGKVREVRSKSDSLITTFRYDGSGNRIEKKVIRKDSLDVTHITHYARDASGNIMGIYKDSLMTEQYVYGSSRLGLYRGGRYNGQQSLGEKQYELSNHLGNVLTVITDNIGINTTDSVWASVVRTGDYYPFGLEMESRVWSDTTSSYRYGFNGKEKDVDEEFGNNTYDYGFRIYNASISRFLSVDPLTFSFPWWTPYQFAGNTPIWASDLDGLETWYTNDGSTSQFLGPLASGFVTKMELSLQKPNAASSSASGIGGVQPVLKVQNSKFVRTEIELNSTFRKFLPSILKHEGGFVDDPDDPGGATNKGITFGTFESNASLLDLEPTLDNLKGLTDEQAGLIYEKRYWNKIKGSDIKDEQVAHQYVDFFINAGNNAVAVMQEVLGEMGENVPVDGKMGERTLESINSVDPEELFNAFKDKRIEYYENLADKKPTLKKFLNGWRKRAESFEYTK